MESKGYISIEECSNYYSVELSFIRQLDDHGLIELTRVNESYTIEHDQLTLLEKYMHMYYDLDVNMEGIEVISHLLNKINSLHEKIKMLQR